jgi:5-methylthioadenosine/S-adenosylhomocysteine deaminase
MIREMKTASLLQKARLLDPLVLDAETALEMATMNGAKALGLRKEIGSIEVGKKADLILVSLKKPHLVPPLNPVSHLVYAANGADVETVIIDGKIVMKDRVVETIDEDEVMRHANERGAKLLARSGLEITPKWTVV